MKKIGKFFSDLWFCLTFNFNTIACMLDEERRINEDGRYDKYWAKKNARAAKREARKHSRA